MAMSPAKPKPSPARILLLPDCGPEVGGGHVMRCLALAEALMARGAACAMLATPSVAKVLDVFAPRELDRIEAADRWDADVVLVDHYRLTAEDERRLGETVAVIDDLADRPHACRLLIDPTLGRAEDAYAALTPAGCRVLTGPAYALLAPGFAQARISALAARRPEAAPRRLLLSLGLTDLGGITERVLRLITPQLGELQVDVAVGGAAPGLPALQTLAAEDPRIGLHVDTREMPSLIAAADVGIGAGGVSTWERATLGLPSISLVLADNQRNLARELDRRGAVLAIEAGEGMSTALPEAFGRLLGEAGLRRRLSETSAILCDGRGAARVAEAVLALVG